MAKGPDQLRPTDVANFHTYQEKALPSIKREIPLNDTNPDGLTRTQIITPTIRVLIPIETPTPKHKPTKPSTFPPPTELYPSSYYPKTGQITLEKDGKLEAFLLTGGERKVAEVLFSHPRKEVKATDIRRYRGKGEARTSTSYYVNNIVKKVNHDPAHPLLQIHGTSSDRRYRLNSAERLPLEGPALTKKMEERREEEVSKQPFLYNAGLDVANRRIIYQNNEGIQVIPIKRQSDLFVAQALFAHPGEAVKLAATLKDLGATNVLIRGYAAHVRKIMTDAQIDPNSPQLIDMIGKGTGLTYRLNVRTDHQTQLIEQAPPISPPLEALPPPQKRSATIYNNDGASFSEFTPREIDILEVLAPEDSITNKDLFERVFGEPFNTKSTKLTSAIFTLRRKLMSMGGGISLPEGKSLISGATKYQVQGIRIEITKPFPPDIDENTPPQTDDQESLNSVGHPQDPTLDLIPTPTVTQDHGITSDSPSPARSRRGFRNENVASDTLPEKKSKKKNLLADSIIGLHVIDLFFTDQLTWESLTTKMTEAADLYPDIARKLTQLPYPIDIAGYINDVINKLRLEARYPGISNHLLSTLERTVWENVSERAGDDIKSHDELITEIQICLYRAAREAGKPTRPATPNKKFN